MKLAIRIKEKSFHETWLAVMRMLVKNIEKYPELLESKTKLAAIINFIWPSIYLIYEDEMQSQVKELDRIDSYTVDVEQEHIMIGEEVDQFIRQHPIGGKEWIVVYHSSIRVKQLQIDIF